MADFIEDVGKFVVEVGDWVQENLGDPAIAAALRDDLGLAEGASVPEDRLLAIKGYGAGLDPDKAAFQETVRDLVNVLMDIGAQFTAGSEVSAWEFVYAIAKLLASDMTRVRAPILYALGKTMLFIVDDPEELAVLDPARLARRLRGESVSDDAEDCAERVAAACGTAAVALDQVLSCFISPHVLEAYYGWDPAPESVTPEADRVSARATTLVFPLPKVGDLTPKVALTLLGVPKEHGGPGLFVAIGGGGSFEATVDRTKFKIEAGAASALSMFIGWDESPYRFELGSGATGHFKLGLSREGEGDRPALRIGEAEGTRFDIREIGLGVDFLMDRAAFRLFARGGELVIQPGEGDGFLRAVLSSAIKLTFDFGFTIDTRGGARLDGGSRVRATIPIDKALGGILNVHTVELSLGGGDAGYDLALDLTTALGLTLGPFRASVDRIGFKLNVAFREGNLGLLDADLGFKAPNGVGLSLDAGIVKGGGYLFLDPERGEYAGALELKIATFGIKAIGLLTTKMPDGSEGWALLLLVYADLPRTHIAFNIFFEGVGGVLGLHHGADVEALQTHLPQGVLDDVLFPKNPVADAPRIINRLRLVFPIRRDAFLIGPIFRLSWGTPRAGDVKLGVVLAADNVFGGTGPVSLSKILLLGQVRIGLPDVDNDTIRIIVDFLGYLDFDARRFGIYARLRDSRIADVLELTGSLLLLVDYGDQPAFVLSVGGFHPRFRDLPAGAPNKLDRVGLKLEIAKFIQLSFTSYFAVTSATIQFGAEVKLTVDLEVMSIEGVIGFDALIYYEPRFSFEAHYGASLTVKVLGETLLGVGVHGMLSGPGLWRCGGKAHFKLLLLEFNPTFDEQWGELPERTDASTSVRELLARDFSNPDNWSAVLPLGTDGLVTLGTEPESSATLAHPLALLRVAQKTAPLNLELEKFGETRIDGPRRFDLQQMTLAGKPVPTTVVKEPLARAAYFELSEEQRLTERCIESFDVGAVSGAGGYVVPTVGADADVSYSTHYLTRTEPDAEFALALADVLGALSRSMLQQMAKAGATGRSVLREKERLRPAQKRKLELTEPAFAALDVRTLARIQLGPEVVTNETRARQKLRGRKYSVLVEESELEEQS